MSTHCKHHNIKKYKDYCPHKGYSIDIYCEDCGTPLRYFKGSYYTYDNLEHSVEVKSIIMVYDEGIQENSITQEGGNMNNTQVREPLELIADSKEYLVVLSLKSKLVMLISKIIESKGMTQKEAAKVMEVTQPRVSNLTNGSLSLFSVDTLLVMAIKIGVDVNVFMDSNGNIFMTATQ